MRYHPTPMTNAFQFPPKSPRTDPHKHSLALIVDVTKKSNIFFRDPKNIFWGRTIAHPGCRGSFWHLLSHPRPLVADSSALFSRWRVRKSAIKAPILTVPGLKTTFPYELDPKRTKLRPEAACQLFFEGSLYSMALLVFFQRCWHVTVAKPCKTFVFLRLDS